MDELCPRALARSDAAALIGILANLEAFVWTDLLPANAIEKLRRRFVADGLLMPNASDREVREVLNGLNHRLRNTLNEFVEEPEPVAS
jgi:hypothetical protein